MELIDFLKNIQNDVQTEIATRTEESGPQGLYAEVIFTEIVTQHMSEIGMTFEPEVCRYHAQIHPIGILRLSGYSISEEADQLDLYVTEYSGNNELENIPDSEIKAAAERCLKFLKYCVEKKLSSKMDESHEAYPLVRTIEEGYLQFEQIRIYVLTDRVAKTRQFQNREIQGKTIKLEVVDISRLFNHLQEGKPRDELIVNFEQVSGTPLPCVWVPNEHGEYDYAMTVIPGEALRYVYEKYGPRILEANVRSFLSQTGKVNKGIRDTLIDQPERFMAYNNGVVIIADEAHLGRLENGGIGISWLKGMQIVNGGQTTASMFFTKKKNPAVNLKAVHVPAKIIVLRKTDPLEEGQLISDISRYANSQNAVKQSDLSANKPYHINLEKLALSTYCPDGVSRWFYERAGGSYKVMLEREGKTPAGIKRIQELIPISRKITKTELAKYVCAWEQKPDLVSLGGQKNFTAFMNMIQSTDEDKQLQFDVTYYKNIIAQTIIFKTAQKVIRSKFPAFQANITAYTVAIVSQKIGSRINFQKIWLNQKLSEGLVKQILIWSEEVNKYLHETAKGRMISEWAKKNECWELLSQYEYSGNNPDIEELK